jgi:hypothetical protein
MDSGFCDQKLMGVIQTLGAGYVCGGRFIPGSKFSSVLKAFEAGRQISKLQL